MKKGFGIFILLVVFSFILMSCGGEKKTETTNEELKNEISEAANEVQEIAPDFAAGEETYNKFCFACHKEGVAGAPLLGDKELWSPRAEKGMSTLIKHVDEGFTGDAGIMPPKGTCMDCSEEDFRNAIAYMLKQADLIAK